MVHIVDGALPGQPERVADPESGAQPTKSAMRNAPRKKQQIIKFDMSDLGDAASSVAAEEEISTEQLQMIKARTMFQMVEEINDVGSGSKRLLFLTNSQAELLAGSSASITKLLDALEIPRPKLLINLLLSHGHTEYCSKSIYNEGKVLCTEQAGLVPGRGYYS